MPLDAMDAIYAAAKKYGIRDPHALAAVAHAESGLNPGSIGDGGTSFGLFQLHQGGALGNMSNTQARAYLDAYKNAEFAARQMRQLGIHKLSGRQAVDAIVRRFERPADPTGEVARAWSWYTKNRGLAGQAGGSGAAFAAPAASTSTKMVGAPSDTSVSFVQNLIDSNSREFHLPRIKLPASAPRNVSFNLAPDDVPVQHVPSPTHIGSAITQAAKQFLGIKYTWGGNTPQQGFDCSGLVKYVFRKFGITTPRVAVDQFNAGQPVDAQHAGPGDLVFFRHGGTIGHVGIYLGNGMMLHAPHTGDVVKISKLAGRDVAGFRRFAR